MFDTTKLLIILFMVLILAIGIRTMKQKYRKTREKRNKILSRLRREDDNDEQ